MVAPALNRCGPEILAVTLILIGSAAIAFSAAQADESKAKNAAGKSDAKEASPPVMTLEVTINKPANPGRGYRRPYVAAWLTDEDDFPVRTILLWVQKDGKGPRWIPDLRQWHRDDRMRGIVSDQDLVDAMSGPTRNTGMHKVAWDGKDDLGVPLPPGMYTLNIEAAREHGTYQILREKLELADKKFEKELAGNEEIKSVRLKYAGQRAAEK